MIFVCQTGFVKKISRKIGMGKIGLTVIDGFIILSG